MGKFFKEAQYQEMAEIAGNFRSNMSLGVKHLAANNNGMLGRISNSALNANNALKKTKAGNLISAIAKGGTMEGANIVNGVATVGEGLGTAGIMAKNAVKPVATKMVSKANSIFKGIKNIAKFV